MMKFIVIFAVLFLQQLHLQEWEQVYVTCAPAGGGKTREELSRGVEPFAGSGDMYDEEDWLLLNQTMISDPLARIPRTPALPGKKKKNVPEVYISDVVEKVIGGGKAGKDLAGGAAKKGKEDDGGLDGKGSHKDELEAKDIFGGIKMRRKGTLRNSPALENKEPEPKNADSPLRVEELPNGTTLYTSDYFDITADKSIKINLKYWFNGTCPFLSSPQGPDKTNIYARSGKAYLTHERYVMCPLVPITTGAASNRTYYLNGYLIYHKGFCKDCCGMLPCTRALIMKKVWSPMSLSMQHGVVIETAYNKTTTGIRLPTEELAVNYEFDGYKGQMALVSNTMIFCNTSWNYSVPSMCTKNVDWNSSCVMTETTTCVEGKMWPLVTLPEAASYRLVKEKPSPVDLSLQSSAVLKKVNDSFVLKNVDCSEAVYMCELTGFGKLMLKNPTMMVLGAYKTITDVDAPGKFVCYSKDNNVKSDDQCHNLCMASNGPVCDGDGVYSTKHGPPEEKTCYCTWSINDPLKKVTVLMMRDNLYVHKSHCVEFDNRKKCLSEKTKVISRRLLEVKSKKGRVLEDIKCTQLPNGVLDCGVAPCVWHGGIGSATASGTKGLKMAFQRERSELLVSQRVRIELDCEVDHHEDLKTLARGDSEGHSSFSRRIDALSLCEVEAFSTLDPSCISHSIMWAVTGTVVSDMIIASGALVSSICIVFIIYRIKVAMCWYIGDSDGSVDQVLIRSCKEELVWNTAKLIESAVTARSVCSVGWWTRKSQRDKSAALALYCQYLVMCKYSADWRYDSCKLLGDQITKVYSEKLGYLKMFDWLKRHDMEKFAMLNSDYKRKKDPQAGSEDEESEPEKPRRIAKSDERGYFKQLNWNKTRDYRDPERSVREDSSEEEEETKFHSRPSPRPNSSESLLRKLWQNSGRAFWGEEGKHVFFIVALIFVGKEVHSLGCTGNAVSVENSDCTMDSANDMVCEIAFISTIILNNVGESVCFALHNETSKVSVGVVEVEYSSLVREWTLANLYYTGDFTYRTRQDAFCTTGGYPCESCDGTRNWLNPWGEYSKIDTERLGLPSWSACTNYYVTCFYCWKQGHCQSITTTIDPRDSAHHGWVKSMVIGEPKTTMSVKVTMYDDKSGVKDSKVSKSSVVGTSSAVNDIGTLTVHGVTNLPTVSFGPKKLFVDSDKKAYLTVCSDLNNPIAGTIGDVQWSSKEIYMTPYKIEKPEEKKPPGFEIRSDIKAAGDLVDLTAVRDGCTSRTIAPGISDLPNRADEELLPNSFGGNRFSYIEKDDILQESILGSRPVQMTLKVAGKYKVTMFSTECSPEMEFVKLIGCYSCMNPGAELVLKTRSKNPFDCVIKLVSIDGSLLCKGSVKFAAGDFVETTTICQATKPDVETTIYTDYKNNASVEVKGTLVAQTLMSKILQNDSSTEESTWLTGGGSFSWPSFAGWFSLSTVLTIIIVIFLVFPILYMASPTFAKWLTKSSPSLARVMSKISKKAEKAKEKALKKIKKEEIFQKAKKQ